LARAELGTIARQRQSDPPQLIELLRGDLDWIVLKALQKDRTRRYATARELARDIEHHLSNQPVTARPPSRLYRLGRLSRRHRFALSTALGLLAALSLVLGVCSYLWVRQRDAKRRADATTVALKLSPQESKLRQLSNLAAESRRAGRLAE